MALAPDVADVFVVLYVYVQELRNVLYVPVPVTAKDATPTSWLPTFALPVNTLPSSFNVPSISRT